MKQPQEHVQNMPNHLQIFFLNSNFHYFFIQMLNTKIEDGFVIIFLNNQKKNYNF
jgi:hypothetical protein